MLYPCVVLSFVCSSRTTSMKALTLALLSVLSVCVAGVTSRCEQRLVACVSQTPVGNASSRGSLADPLLDACCRLALLVECLDVKHYFQDCEPGYQGDAATVLSDPKRLLQRIWETESNSTGTVSRVIEAAGSQKIRQSSGCQAFAFVNHCPSRGCKRWAAASNLEICSPQDSLSPRRPVLLVVLGSLFLLTLASLLLVSLMAAAAYAVLLLRWSRRLAEAAVSPVAPP